MNKTKEIIKNIILRLKIQDAFFETYGYLDVSNGFTVKERLKRILDIIVYENHCQKYLHHVVLNFLLFF